MASGNPFGNLFGKSPIKPIQEHMQVADQAAQRLTAFMQAKMDDDWERLYFGDLSHDGTADGDKDGYTDFQEYLNFSQGIMDSEGKPFDPTIANAPGGPGYNAPKKSIWILMMPVLMGNNQ